MHLYLFLVLIVSLSCGSLPAGDADPARAAIATAAMVTAWIVLTHVGARVCAIQVRRKTLDPLSGADILEKQLAAFRWLGLAIVVLCLGGFGLAPSLDTVAVLQSSVFLQALILLAPGLAILTGTWSAEHMYGVMLNYTSGGFRNYLRTVWQLFRACAAWLVAPVMILLGLSDLIGMLPIGAVAAGWTSAGLILLFVPLGLPWLIRYLFNTEPLSAGDEAWAGRLLHVVGLRRTRAVRWNTGGRTFNALVAGFIPPIRTLLLSDRLLDELPRRQIAMVVLHEAAHLRRRHVPLRMLSILPAWGIGTLVTRVAGGHSWAMAAGSGVGILMTMLVLRLVAYRTELDADVQACRMAAEISERVEDVPATYEEAAETLSAALLRVTFDQPSARRASWLHPGVAERVDWMRRQRDVPISKTTSAATIVNPA